MAQPLISIFLGIHVSVHLEESGGGQAKVPDPSPIPILASEETAPDDDGGTIAVEFFDSDNDKSLAFNNLVVLRPRIHEELTADDEGSSAVLTISRRCRWDRRLGRQGVPHGDSWRDRSCAFNNFTGTRSLQTMKGFDCAANMSQVPFGSSPWPTGLPA